MLAVGTILSWEELWKIATNSKAAPEQCQALGGAILLRHRFQFFVLLLQNSHDRCLCHKLPSAILHHQSANADDMTAWLQDTCRCLNAQPWNPQACCPACKAGGHIAGLNHAVAQAASHLHLVCCSPGLVSLLQSGTAGQGEVQAVLLPQNRSQAPLGVAQPGVHARPSPPPLLRQRRQPKASWYPASGARPVEGSWRLDLQDHGA